jgi:hypothetical protein
MKPSIAIPYRSAHTPLTSSSPIPRRKIRVLRVRVIEVDKIEMVRSIRKEVKGLPHSPGKQLLDILFLTIWRIRIRIGRLSILALLVSLFSSLGPA